MKHRENKTFSHILNVPVRQGELTVMGTDSAELSMMHSMRLASASNKLGVGVLVVNCGMSNRRFREHFDEKQYEYSLQDPRLVIHTSNRGNLVGEREYIEQVVSEGKISMLILVGWEWASDTPRRRRRLLTFLRELMDERDVAVVVYANCMHDLKAGYMDHGGLGKLTLMAYAAARVEGAEELETLAPRRAPIVASSAELHEAARGVHKLLSKLNKLPGENGGPDEGDAYAEAA